MAKGQRTKAGHIIQMIYHGADPNKFNPNGKRVVAHNAEDYDYIDGIEFDKLGRKGAKALIANVPLEEMWAGKISGPLHYNLMDDQIFPFWIAKGVETPITVDGINCIDTVYERPQLDRADRAFFSIEEGKAGGGADLGCYGMFTSFKWTSKRGNKGKSRFEVGFVTQAAVRRQSLTGGAAQNHKTRITAANVAGALGLSIVVPGLAAKAVSLAIGNTAAQNIAAFAAVGLTVGSTGSIAAAAGEVHRLTATNATGNATIYDTITVTPGMTALALETAIQAKGGTFATRTVAGNTTAITKIVLSGVGGVALGNNVATPENAFDGVDATTVSLPVGAQPYGNSYVAWVFTTPKVINAFRSRDAIGNGSVIASLTGDFSDVVTLKQFSGSGLAADTISTFANTVAYKAYAFMNAEGFAKILKGVEFLGDSASNGTYAITTPVNVGDVTDITVTPGTGWSTTSTQPGAAGGLIDLEFTSPSNVLVSVTKASGDAGYVLSTPQYGSDGSILQAMKEDDPIMPGHLFLYSADTPAGLEDEANLIGQIGEWEIDDPKICMPVSHHVPIVDPARPDLPATYNSHAEEESQEDGIKLNITMDADENGEVIATMQSLLRASGKRLVSKPRYWRIVAIHPGSPQRVWLDFYGSIGNSAPVKWGGNVEQYTFVYDLLENKGAPWNFKAKTRRLA